MVSLRDLISGLVSMTAHVCWPHRLATFLRGCSISHKARSKPHGKVPTQLKEQDILNPITEVAFGGSRVLELRIRCAVWAHQPSRRMVRAEALQSSEVNGPRQLPRHSRAAELCRTLAI